MRYLRRWLAIRYLVLVAMVAQASVAFGHVHLYASQATVSLHGRSLAASVNHPPCHPGHQDSGCVICWAVGIGGATLVHDLAAAAQPEACRGFLPSRVDRAAPTIEASAFDARGPPARAPEGRASA